MGIRYGHNSNYQTTCKVCGAPRYDGARMAFCRWHYHEYRREKMRAWRQKRKVQP